VIEQFGLVHLYFVQRPGSHFGEPSVESIGL
jgi:hypothetical protein